MAFRKTEFRKIRDAGENLNDTFSFISQHFRPLIGSFFAICGIFMLASAIISSMYKSRFFGIINTLQKGVVSGDNTLGGILDANYFLMFGFSLLTYVAMKVAFNAYVKFQLGNNRFPAIEEVWTIFKKYFFRVLSYSLLIWFIVFAVTGVFAGVAFLALRHSIANALLVVPMMFAAIIYVTTVFTPFDSIVMLEDADFSRAFSRCFELMKNNVLSSFFMYCIGYIIYAVFSGVILMVSGYVTQMAGFFTTRKVDASVEIATAFFDVFSNTFFILFLVSSTFHYFTLAEKKDGTGILQRINDIGTEKNNFDNIEEQY